MVLSINRASAEDEQIKEDLVERIFDKWWPDLNRELTALAEEFPDETGHIKRVSKQEAALNELLQIARAQQNVLLSPESLLPRHYIDQVVRRIRKTPVNASYEVADALQDLEREFHSLRKLVRRSKRVSKDELMLAVDALRDPLNRLAYEIGDS